MLVQSEPNKPRPQHNGYRGNNNNDWNSVHWSAHRRDAGCLDENWCLLQMQKDRTLITRLSFEESRTPTTDTAAEGLHIQICSHKNQKHDGWTKERTHGDVDSGFGFLKKEPVSMTVTPSICILNVIVVEIENNSMTILISLSSEQNGKKNVETKAWLDTGAGGKFIDQNFVLKNDLRTHKLARPITVYNVDGTENKTGTITRYIDVNPGRHVTVYHMI